MGAFQNNGVGMGPRAFGQMGAQRRVMPQQLTQMPQQGGWGLQLQGNPFEQAARGPQQAPQMRAPVGQQQLKQSPFAAPQNRQGFGGIRRM